MALELRRRVSEVLNNSVLPFFSVRGTTDKVATADLDKNNNLIVTPRDENNNPISGTTPDMDGQSPNGVNVTSVDQIIIPANPNRVALVMTNDSDTVIYIGIGEASAPNGAPRVNTAGGVYTLSRYGTVFSTGAIHASHGGVGNKVLTYQEFH